MSNKLFHKQIYYDKDEKTDKNKRIQNFNRETWI